MQIIQDLDLHVPKSLAEFASTYTSLDSSNDFALKVLKSEEVIDTRQDHPPLKHSRIKRKSLHEKESIQIRELNHFTKSLANPSKLWRSVRQFSRKVLPDPKRKPAIINKFENPQLSILDSPLSPQKSKNDCSVIASATPECVFRRKRRHLTPVSVSTPDQTKSTGQASHFNNDELAPLIRPLF